MKIQVMRLKGATLFASMLLTIVGFGSASAAGKVVVAAAFAPTGGWAMETDDAFVLAKAGCLEGLARVDFDGQLQPALASKWTQVSPTEWDITVRSGVRFQNGEKLDAAAVAGALNRVLKADAPPRAFSPKRVSSVAATGAMTVRITTPKASVLLPHRLASPNTGILAPSAFAGDRVNPMGACTGPFEIVEDIPQQAIRLKRNDNYWGGKVTLDSAEFRFIPDGSVRATQVQTGEAHIARAVPVSSLQKLQSASGVKVLSIETPRTNGLYFNNQKAPFDNAKARQAVQAAIDTKAIAEAIYEGSAIPAVGPFNPSEPWAPGGAKAVSYNPARAKQLLSEGGINPGDAKLTLLAYTERAELPDLAAVIQGQLADIGMQVEIRSANYAGIEPDLNSGNFHMFVLSRNHLSDVADPIGFLTADYTCEGGYNLSRFCDPAIDTALEKASSFEDPDKRNEIYAGIAKQLQNQAVTTFLVHVQGSDAISSNVTNYRVHPYSHYVLTPGLSIK